MAYIILTLLTLAIGLDGRKQDDVGVVRELWSNVPGDGLQGLLSDDRFPHKPTVVSFIRNFDAPPSQHGENIAQRIKGYFVAPQDGEYNFFSSCGGSCEVFFNSDGKQGENNRIVSQKHSTRRNQFLKYPEQSSRSFLLKKGQVTYLEAINKQGTSTDTLSVGVQLPNGDRLFPIPSDLLRKSKLNKGSQDEYDVQTYKTKPTVSVGARRTLNKPKSSPIVDFDGNKYNDKDAIEPGINIFQDTKNSDIMEAGDYEDSVSLVEDKVNKKKSKDLPTRNIAVQTGSNSDNAISNEEIENINFSENKKLVSKTKDPLQKTISSVMGNSRTFVDKNRNIKRPVVKTETGSSRQTVGLGLSPLDHGLLTDHHHTLPLIHHNDHHILTDAHIDTAPVQPLRHTGKVALVPAIVHHTDGHYDHETGHYHPEHTRIDPEMHAEPVADHTNHIPMYHQTGEDLEHALGVMGDLHHEEIHEKAQGHGTVAPKKPPPQKKKPDVVKVEFVPEETEVTASRSDTKKGGSVRVQFIAGENKAEIASSTPSGDTRAASDSSNKPTNEQEQENTAIPSNALASKLKDTLQGKEKKIAPQKVTETTGFDKTKENEHTSPSRQEAFIEQQKEYASESRPGAKSYRIIDGNGLPQGAKAVNGYEVNPQLPSMGKQANTGDARTTTNDQNPGGFTFSQTDNAPHGSPSIGGENNAPHASPSIGGENNAPHGSDGDNNANGIIPSDLKPGEERIDSPFTALGQKYPESVALEEKEAALMENKKQVPGQERVFFGGGDTNGGVASGRSGPSLPEISQPDPNPTHNAPEAASSDENGFNPVATHLTSALADNMVSPEEALQMMNDFVSGNQDMNKAAKNIEGMLGQISTTRHNAPSPFSNSEEPVMRPPADVASPISDDSHHFISNPNDINPDLTTGYNDPNLEPSFHKPQIDTSVIPSAMLEHPSGGPGPSLGNRDADPTRISFENNENPIIQTEGETSQSSYAFPQQQEQVNHDERPPESREAVMEKLNHFSTNGPPAPVDVYEGQIPEFNKVVQQRTGETRSPGPHSVRPSNQIQNNNDMIVESFQSPNDGYANPMFDHTRAAMRKIIPDLSSGKIPMNNILDKMDPHEIPGSTDPSSQYFLNNKHETTQSLASITSSLLDEGSPKQINSFIHAGDFIGNRQFDLASLRSKPVNSDLTYDMNQPVGHPMNAFFKPMTAMGLPVGQFERKFKTPHAPGQEAPKLKPKIQKHQTGKKKDSVLADMYADSLFPEDKMDIASLEKSLSGNTITGIDEIRTRVRSKVPPRPVKNGKLKKTKGRNFPITKKLKPKFSKKPHKNPKKTRQGKQKDRGRKNKKSNGKRKKIRRIFKRTKIPVLRKQQHKKTINDVVDNLFEKKHMNGEDSPVPNDEDFSFFHESNSGVKNSERRNDQNSAPALPRQEHASLRKLVSELKNVLYEIKESPRFKSKSELLNGERQLTEDDIMNMEGVSKSDLIGAFVSMKKLSNMHPQVEDQRALDMTDYSQSMFEPGYNSPKYKRQKINKGRKKRIHR